MNRSIIAALALLLLTGCAATTKEVKVSAAPIAKPKLVTPDVSKLNMRDVKWIVVNKNNVDKVFADIQKSGGSIVLFAVTPKGYEALSLNISDLRKLVRQQQAIIAAYKKYYN